MNFDILKNYFVVNIFSEVVISNYHKKKSQNPHSRTVPTHLSQSENRQRKFRNTPHDIYPKKCAAKHGVERKKGTTSIFSRHQVPELVKHNQIVEGWA